MDAASLEIGEHHHAVAARVGIHEHRRAFACLLVSGRYEERIGGRNVVYRPSTVVLHGPGLAHSDRISAGGRLFGIRLGACWAARLADARRREPFLVGEPGSALAWLLARAREEWRRAEPGADLAIEGLLLEAAALWLRAPAEDRPRWMGRLEDALRGALHRPLRLARLAADVGVDAPRMARTFRRVQGLSLSAYLRRLRVEEACRRIAKGEGPLADVAAEAGFADQSHMTRTFRRVLGTTPAAYRRTVRRR